MQPSLGLHIHDPGALPIISREERERPITVLEKLSAGQGHLKTWINTLLRGDRHNQWTNKVAINVNSRSHFRELKDYVTLDPEHDGPCWRVDNLENVSGLIDLKPGMPASRESLLCAIGPVRQTPCLPLNVWLNTNRLINRPIHILSKLPITKGALVLTNLFSYLKRNVANMFSSVSDAKSDRFVRPVYFITETLNLAITPIIAIETSLHSLRFFGAVTQLGDVRARTNLTENSFELSTGFKFSITPSDGGF